MVCSRPSRIRALGSMVELEALVDLAVFGLDKPGLVLRLELIGRLQDGLNDLSAVKGLADVREFGPEFAAAMAERMALGAGSRTGQENSFTGGWIAALGEGSLPLFEGIGARTSVARAIGTERIEGELELFDERDLVGSGSHLLQLFLQSGADCGVVGTQAKKTSGFGLDERIRIVQETVKAGHLSRPEGR